MLRQLLYIISFCTCLAATAQQKQYVYTHLSSKDGLASNHVYSILQDKKGFMWFGTANGLQRYDGKKVISFRNGPGDTSFIPSDRILQMHLDKHNRFWVRIGKDIGIFNFATFFYQRIPIQVPRDTLERSESHLWEDNEGNVFMALSKAGMLAYNSKLQAFVRDTNIINSPENSFIVKFQQDPVNANYYWIGHARGLALFDRKQKKLYTHENNPIQNPILKQSVAREPVTTFMFDDQSRLWIGNWTMPANRQFISLYDPKWNRLISPVNISATTDKYREFHSFRQQKNGKVWLFGLGVLAEYSEASGQFEYIYNEHPDDFGIRYETVHCFFEDREQNVWLGTDQGIYVFNPIAQRFTSISLSERTQRPETQNRSLTTFLQLQNGDIWGGSWGQGIFSYDNQFRPKPNKIIDPDTRDGNYFMIWSMLEHSSTKKIWIGCQAGRLMIYDPAFNKTTYLRHPVFDIRTIRTLGEDKNGNIWFGTQHGRLIKWEADKGGGNLNDGFELKHKFNSNIYKLKIDENGLIWVASELEGITVFDLEGNLVTRYNDKGGPGRSLSSNLITDILFYNDTLVVVCADELNIINKKTGIIQHIAVSDGLPSNTAHTAQRDEEGNLWIGLINGLCRYNMKRNIFTLFSQKDGIVNNEFHEGSSYLLRDGRMIFNNQRDFIYFNPRQILSSSIPPDVSITDFKLFNTYLPPDSILQLDRVMLNHNQNSITIEFAALSFLQKDKMVYYIMLDGIDHAWTRVDRYNVANYSLLPPGDYTFKVKCENGDGIPSKNITSLRIHIKPPFWRQEWFILLCILVVAGLIYLAHRMRVRQLIEMEKVRGRIARDLHDDMGSTLSTINILSEMAKMKVNKDTEKTSEYISKISDNSNRMMEAMDDIVWSINPMNDSMQRITARMREFATSVLEAKDITVIFKVDEGVNDLRLDMESRRDFFLIFKEAVNNIAKYSQARHTSIEISVHGNKVVMLIKDDGIGFDVQQADNGNGLSNMKKRAESLKGNFSIDSVPGIGTKVKLEAALT